MALSKRVWEGWLDINKKGRLAIYEKQQWVNNYDDLLVS
jgi:hypothetical protein